ncbi:MAG TPA: ribonuclease III [Candidatus Caccosoma faecigallinarum]|jgi:ribonuclease III|uniref:Ribonuclease 3 n=1 Tax=Candidatus Caccosoma faecigallinarum TaxID=2840720 RepID=A0A9D1G8A8_9FIRM|nr:ribonuclease III [Candidatus Caccosoma faecigallinarum]
MNNSYLQLLRPYHILPKNPDLYLEALTHSSYANEENLEKDYQRLEFMGDAVFQIVSADMIFKKYPFMQEGEMTKLRIKLVQEVSLAQLGRHIKINTYMRLGHGEEKSHGRDKDSLIADCVEAFLGAIYIDHGFKVAKKVALSWLNWIFKDLPDLEVNDYKSQLQELIQSDSREPLRYVEIKSLGSDNNKTFYFKVVHNGIELGRGKGKTKKEAEQFAAKEALLKVAK